MTSRITLEHGSGGALSRELIENYIYPRFQSDVYSALSDAALLETAGKTLFTTDTYTVQPYIFPGGDIGKLAVCGTCNDLAVSGGKPRFLSMGMVLEEGFPLPDLEVVLDSAAASCGEIGVKVVTGDTKVVPKGKGGSIYINTAGIGELEAEVVPDCGRVVPGDKVVVSGPVGSHGIALLSAREDLPLTSPLNSDTASLYPLCKELFCLGEGLRFIRDATRGGVAAVCNEIVSGAGFGMELKETSFPVLKEVSALSEILGLNPLEVANEGVFIAVLAPEVLDDGMERLRAFPAGKHAACVGTITEDYRGKVVLTTAIGGRRTLGFPRGLLLPRIC